ncbi:acyltransferase family protein [Xylanibacter ruminicola]|uniref:acyltransferase family protein n=1 Tax=Xylanibacter ruminicola TaxID=839 RepID=UPI0009BD936F
MHKNRLNWIDATKGFAMLLVIWGHVQETSPLYLYVTSFHVPLFLVVSGMLFAINGRVGGVNLYSSNL